jgi:hypothetical protein
VLARREFEYLGRTGEPLQDQFATVIEQSSALGTSSNEAIIPSPVCFTSRPRRLAGLGARDRVGHEEHADRRLLDLGEGQREPKAVVGALGPVLGLDEDHQHVHDLSIGRMLHDGNLPDGANDQSATASIGKPAACHASKPPSMSDARAHPRSRRIAAAMLE